MVLFIIFRDEALGYQAIQPLIEIIIYAGLPLIYNGKLEKHP